MMIFSMLPTPNQVNNSKSISYKSTGTVVLSALATDISAIWFGLYCQYDHLPNTSPPKAAQLSKKNMAV